MAIQSWKIDQKRTEAVSGPSCHITEDQLKALLEGDALDTPLKRYAASVMFQEASLYSVAEIKPSERDKEQGIIAAWRACLTDDPGSYSIPPLWDGQTARRIIEVMLQSDNLGPNKGQPHESRWRNSAARLSAAGALWDSPTLQPRAVVHHFLNS